MVGLMGWCDMPFNPANIMTLPLVIGIGVTNGIHILNRFAEDSHPGILAQSTGKAVLVSALNTIVAVVVGSLAAYSLSRLRYPGRQYLSGLFFFVYLIPASLLFVPLFVILNDFGLLNSLWGLTWVYLTFTVPFCTWILKAYFANIPADLEEAALVDGATRLRALYHVLLPMAAPGIAAAAIFAFTLSWNEFLYAYTFIRDVDKLTLAPGLTNMLFGDVFQWGQIMSAAVLMSLPTLVLYFVAQRYVVAGLTAGAVKG